MVCRHGIIIDLALVGFLNGCLRQAACELDVRSPPDINHSCETEGQVQLLQTQTRLNNLYEEKHQDQPGTWTNHLSIIATTGCTGSTEAHSLTNDLIQSHGVRNLLEYGKEFLKGPTKIREFRRKYITHEERNSTFCFAPNGTALNYSDDPFVRLQQAEDRLQGKIECSNEDVFSVPTLFMLTVMDEWQGDNVTKLLSFMDPSRSAVALWKRKNELDYLICTIHDCLPRPEDTGYSVDGSGKQISSPCMLRRDLNITEGDMKVYLDPDRLVQALARPDFWADGEVGDELRRRYGSRLGRVTDDDAWAFEYSFEPAAMETSIKAWSTMLQALGVLPNRSIIEAELRARQIAMSEPMRQHNHSIEIYNFEEAKAVLVDAGLEHLLRY
eukprot:TRINITY_DN75127_c0_g1_i1.p1 TRINITY_DN75127_c0_g1~~TRINITY_DN75127_c0_g1_i1.p1  ORF type:complete len:413 (+),score=81.80 TRINITY_DN75127_c0_g1_i1:87-1241(+)